MNRAQHTMGSARSGRAGTVGAATEILAGRSGKCDVARLLPCLGPLFVASVA